MIITPNAGVSHNPKILPANHAKKREKEKISLFSNLAFLSRV